MKKRLRGFCRRLPIRLHDPGQLREMDLRSFPKVTSELPFEELDCPRKRRLCDMALSRRLREAQMFAYRKKMPDLVHFHAFPVESKPLLFRLEHQDG